MSVTIPQKVRDIVLKKDNIIEFTEDTRVDHALKTLTENNITSAPVKGSDGQYIGFLDMLDLLHFLVYNATKEKHSRVTPPSHHLFYDDMDMILQRSNDFSLSKLREGDLANLSRRNPWLPVKEDDSVVDAISLFAKGVHRLPVVDADGKLVNIISQSDVVKHLAEYPDERLGENATKTATELGFLKPVGKVKASMVTVDAFIHMYAQQFSSVAIVDDDNVLVGNLSASDLKGISLYNFRSLLTPVHSWVREVRRHAQNKPRNYSVWVIPTTPFRTIIKKLAVQRVHRCFIVNDQQQPVGVVTLTDALQIVYGTVKK